MGRVGTDAPAGEEMAATAGAQPPADLAATATAGDGGSDDLVVTEVRLDLGDGEAGDPVRLIRQVRLA